MKKKVSILCFAGFQERVGRERIELVVEREITAAELRQLLSDLYPQAKDMLVTSMVAVNQEYASATTPIRPGDEVAIIPPVSGG
jgi:MoaE-MoaD fusion protein